MFVVSCVWNFTISQGLRVFLPVFLRNEDTYSLKFRFLSICKPRNLCYLPKLFNLQFEPKYSHAYSQIPTGDICLDLVLYYFSETIQLLVSYHVSVFSSRSLDLCHRQKMWYHLQSYKPARWFWVRITYPPT